MRHNVILNESQFKGYIRFLNRQRLMKEDVQSQEYNVPEKIFNMFKYLEDNFVQDTTIGKGDFDLPNKVYRCAVAKNDVPENHNNNDTKIYSDDDLFYMLQAKFSKYFKSSDFRDNLIKKLINGWFTHKIEVKGVDCAIINP